MRKRYHDAASAEGCQNGLLYLISEESDRKALPHYFVYGSKKELRSLTAFKRGSGGARELHGQAYKQAERIAQQWALGILPHHMPEF